MEIDAGAKSVHQDWLQIDPLVVGRSWLQTQIEKQALPDIDYEWLASQVAETRSQARDVIIVQILDPTLRTRRCIVDAGDGARVLVAPANQWQQLVDSISNRAAP